MDYKRKYLKYKSKYIKLKAGSPGLSSRTPWQPGPRNILNPVNRPPTYLVPVNLNELVPGTRYIRYWNYVDHIDRSSQFVGFLGEGDELKTLWSNGAISEPDTYVYYNEADFLEYGITIP